MGILYVYLSGNIKYPPAGRSSHENRPAWIFFGQKKWQKSQIPVLQFFRRLFGKLISVHFCSRELSQTPNGCIDNGKFFICWYHIFHILWMSDQNMVSFADIRYFLILLKDFLNNAKMWKSSTDFPRKWYSAIENISLCDHFTPDLSSFGHLFEDLSSFENLQLSERKCHFCKQISRHD